MDLICAYGEWTSRSRSWRTASPSQAASIDREACAASNGRSSTVSALPGLFHDAATLTATAGLLYGGILAVVALTAVLARTPERRRDARSTLTILMKRRRLR
jgi:hypothetical protein